MSVRIMSAAWAVDLAAGEKLVLLALADCANDEGKCWPGLASLARKTGKSRRSLIDTIHALEKGGHLSRDVLIGKGVNYTIHPQDQAELPLSGGAKPAPVQKSHQCKKTYPSGAKPAPKPSGTVRDNTDPNGSVGESPEIRLQVEHVVEAWNDTAERYGLPKVLKLTPERRQRVMARIRENSLDDFKAALAAIERSPFLRGEGKGGWRANFDFFTQKSSFTKLVEGTYAH